MRVNRIRRHSLLKRGERYDRSLGMKVGFLNGSLFVLILAAFAIFV